MSRENSVRVSADPQLPDSRAFCCPLLFYQHLQLSGAFTDFERRVFEEMEFCLGGEQIGERRPARFRFSVGGKVYHFMLEPDDETDDYHLVVENAGRYEFVPLN